MVQCGNRITPYHFLVANIGEDNLVLGFSFLEAAESKIDWAKGQLEDDIYLMGWEEWQELENDVMFHLQITQVIMAQMLAEKAINNKEHTWQQIL